MTAPSPLLVAARTLAIDGVTAEVVSAWAGAGIPAVLLKGPTLASWLYDESRPRLYGDSDLFVGPESVEAAREVLRRLGFEPYPGDSLHAITWARGSDGAEVDLHHALWGVWRPAADQWRILTKRFTEPATVGGVTVTVPTRPACALFVVLHAAQHKDRLDTTPHEDLRRALAVATIADWRAAEHVADRLNALDAFAEGLALEPAGAHVAAALPVLTAIRRPEHERSLAMLAARVGGAPDVRARWEALWQGIGLGRDELEERYPTSPRGVATVRRVMHLVANVGRVRRRKRP